MLAPLKLFATKLAIFSTVLLYLALDLWAFQGPVWKLVHEKAIHDDSADPVLARLYGETIHQSDWLAHEKEMAFAHGVDKMPSSARTSVLMSLLRSSLLPLRLNYNDNNVPRFPQEAQAELKRLASRAQSPEDWKAFLRTHELSEEELLSLIESRYREAFLLDRSIASAKQLSKEELLPYYDLVKEQFRIPASREVKHIFLRSLGKDAAELEQQAKALLSELQAGADFTSMAREHSEDAATAAKGGSLGIIYEGLRMPLPELSLFGSEAIASDKPVLLQSQWGWHILLASPLRASHIPELSVVEPSLRSALISARRAWAVDAYFESSFRALFKEEFLHIYER